MSHTNKLFRYFTAGVLSIFISNIFVPLFQNTFAIGTQYYVDFGSGDDSFSGTLSSPWKTLSKINSLVLEPADKVWLSCGNSWNEDIVVNGSGSAGSPVAFHAWQAPTGPNCAGGNYPSVRSIIASNTSDIDIGQIKINASSGAAIDINNSSNIQIIQSSIKNSGGGCIKVFSGSNILLTGSTLDACTYALSGANMDGTIRNNTFSGMTENALTVSSSKTVTINNNTFKNLTKGAIVFGPATTISQNDISSVCQGTSTGCSAITNSLLFGSNYIFSSISENIIKNVGNGVIANNYGINLIAASQGDISSNTVNNAEEALHMENSEGVNIHDNTFVLSRARGVSIIKNIGGNAIPSTFDRNILLQKNPDYPYMEMRDEVATGATAVMVTPSENKFYPLYKPNTSYVRILKHGGETLEYSKNQLNLFDALSTRFEDFAFKPYTSTGFVSGGNRIGNGDFSTGTSLWVASAAIGSAPTLSGNTSGSYSGGSLQVIPAGGNADRIWLTNTTNISIVSGNNYQVSAYVKSSSGNINLRAFLHAASDKNILYSDRIAETYASASGRVFTFYIQANTGASDATLTFETSNQNVNYEIDSVSIYRVSPFIKNNIADEVLILSNTGTTNLSQMCPSGISGQCNDYFDGSGAILGAWDIAPISIAPYKTFMALWSQSTNILNTPDCSSSLTLPSGGGSVPAGVPINISWNIPADSQSQTVTYDMQGTGIFIQSVGLTGSVTYIPRYTPSPPVTTHFTIEATNDVGTRTCQSDITAGNTSPDVFPTTTSGNEDDSPISGSMSGIDYNPGDQVIFDNVPLPGNPTVPNGIFVQGTGGSFDFYPNPDYCTTPGNPTTFDFSAHDQLGAGSSVVTHTIFVACINDTPVANTDTASGYTALPFIINVTANDTDVDSPYVTQAFTLTGFSQPTNGAVVVSGTGFSYTSNPSFSGSDSFQYRIVDQSGALSNLATVNVTITKFNNPPIPVSTSYTINEDTTLSGVSLTGSDADGDILSFTALTLPTSGTLSLLPGGSLTYTPNVNYNGSDSFIFRVSDGMDTSTGIINLTINPIPDSPVATNDSISPLQGSTTFIPVMSNDFDVDMSPLTLTGYTSPTSNGGTVINTGTGFLYTPANGYSGLDSFTYRLIDDTALLSNIATVSINVTPTNTAPSSFNLSVSTNEDTLLNATLSGSDPELDTLTYVLDSGVSNGALTFYSTGGFKYIPTANYGGVDTLTYHVNDGVLSSTASTVTITVIPVNDIPTGVSASYNVIPNTTSSSGHVFTGVVAGSDIDGSPLTFTSATIPTNGLLTLSSTGYFTYIPALGYIGTDTFTFFANDGTANSIAVPVSLVVGVVVVPPPVVPPSSGPGGGGGGGGGGGSVVSNPIVTSSSTSTPVVVPTTPKIEKTPVVKPDEEQLHPVTENKPFEFVLYDPSGLLSQLLLTNRILGATGSIAPISHEKTEAEKIVEETFGSILDTLFGDINDSSMLRSILQIFILRADTAKDTVTVYDTAIKTVVGWEFDGDSPLAKTKKYILRILERNKKHYEEVVYRNTLARFEEELDSASEEIKNTEGF